MKKRLLCLLASIGVGLTCVSPASGVPVPSSTEMGRLVSQAATYVPGQSRAPLRQFEEMVAQSATDSALREAVEAGLIRLLGPASTFEARRFACQELGIIGDKAALPALAPLLKSNETASLACLALTSYPPGKADDLLREALADAPALARVQIITTLGDRCDAASVEMLERLARKADRPEAEAALAALGKIGDKAAWNALTALAPAASPALRPALTEATAFCAASLAAAGDHKRATAAYEELLQPSQPAYLRRAALKGLLRLDKDEGEQRIMQVLRGSDAVLKPVAIAAVRGPQSRQASAKFAAELPKLQPQEQVWMIESLAVRGDAPARAAITRSLAAQDADVRRAAIRGLGRAGDASSVPPLAQAAAHCADEGERSALEDALTELHGGLPVDQAILAELKTAPSDARVTLIAVLARRQGPAANAVLFEQAGAPDPAAAKAAFQALQKTALGTDVPSLLRLMVDAQDASVRAEAESAARQALARVNDASSRTASVMDALRRTQAPEGISSLLSLLPQCGDAQALAVLKAALMDPAAYVRDMAVRALAEWPDTSAWDILASIYTQGSTEAVRDIAVRGLVRLARSQNAHPDSQLIGRYRQLLTDSRGDADVRLILGALMGVADPEALQLALDLCANSGVRAEARAAVKRIAESIQASHPQAAREALERIQAP